MIRRALSNDSAPRKSAGGGAAVAVGALAITAALYAAARHHLLAGRGGAGEDEDGSDADETRRLLRAETLVYEHDGEAEGSAGRARAERRLVDALEAVRARAAGEEDGGAAFAQEMREGGGLLALARLAVHGGDPLPPRAAAALAGAVDALCVADETVLAELMDEGGLPLLVGVLAQSRDVRVRLFSADALRRHLPAAQGSLRPPESPHGGGGDAVAAAGRLVDLLLTLVHDHSDVDESTTALDVDAVRRAWSADDESGGTPLYAVESMLGHLRRLLKDDSLHYHCVRALATLSELPSNRLRIVRGGGVGLLHELYAAHREESRLCVQAARALANLAGCREGAGAIVAAGFLMPLVCWARGESDDEAPFTYFHEVKPSLRLRLQALRAVQNMRSAVRGRGPDLADEVYSFAPQLLGAEDFADADDVDGRGDDPVHQLAQEQQRHPVDVVLVHGIMGSPLGTWRLADDAAAGAVRVTEAAPEPAPPSPARALLAYAGEADDAEVGPGAGAGGGRGACAEREVLWPLDWLPGDVARGSRVLSVGYRSVLTSWSGATRDLGSRARRLARQLRRAGVGREGRPTVFVTHSMGGLLVKQMLIDEPEMARATAGVVFYATPHAGSQWPQLATGVGAAFRPTNEVMELGDRDALLDLNSRFCELGLPALSVGETRPTPVPPSRPNSPVRVIVVQPDSSNPGYGDYVEVEANHMDVCKPHSRDDPIYSRVLEFVGWAAASYAEAAPPRGAAA